LAEEGKNDEGFNSDAYLQQMCTFDESFGDVRGPLLLDEVPEEVQKEVRRKKADRTKLKKSDQVVKLVEVQVSLFVSAFDIQLNLQHYTKDVISMQQLRWGMSEK
uniref:Condensin complex subunit 2 n=1 Tax=Gongylonema pulchrum TaxID=637853 RepID=A0A183DXP5_9BILA